MALDTYAGLQATVASFLNRDDLTAVIPDFIRLAEAQVQRDIRHWQMQDRATTAINSRYTSRPGDWVETIRFTIDALGYRELRLISMSDMARKRAISADVAGVPQYFCYSQDEIEVFPTADGNYTGELVYYKIITPLSSITASNWLLSAAPDVYLYGALIHSAPFLHDDARTQTWAAFYQAAVAKLNRESERSQVSNETLVMGRPS